MSSKDYSGGGSGRKGSSSGRTNPSTSPAGQGYQAHSSTSHYQTSLDVHTSGSVRSSTSSSTTTIPSFSTEGTGYLTRGDLAANSKQFDDLHRYAGDESAGPTTRQDAITSVMRQVDETRQRVDEDRG